MKRLRKPTWAEGQIQNANKFLKDGAGHTTPRRTNRICGTWRPERQNGKIEMGRLTSYCLLDPRKHGRTK